MSLRNVGGIISATLNGINYPVQTVEYLVVAGGGGGGNTHGGGGGAGGLLTGVGFPITIGTTKPATPRIALGNPSNDACQRSKRAPQEINGLISQLGLVVGFCRTFTLSTRSATEARRPIIPKRIKVRESQFISLLSLTTGGTESPNSELTELITEFLTS